MAHATPFQTEAWTEYGIGVIIILLRIFARFRVVGIKNWQGDDYFTFVVLAFWTVKKLPLPRVSQHVALTDARQN